MALAVRSVPRLKACAPCAPHRGRRPAGRHRASAVALAAVSAVARRPTRVTPWPESRFWVQKLPNGTARVSRQRSADAFMAFDAYSQQMPGTKELRLGELRSMSRIYLL